MQAPEDQTDTFRLEVIELLSQRANFPLLSANIFLKSSLVDFEGNPVEVNGAGCYPKDPRSKINWLKASQPTFHLLNAPQKPLFQPYTVIKKAGLKIAIIGIDHANTPIATTPDNVKHLCFRDEKSTYYDTQKYLEKTEKPDIYVLIIHDGDVPEFEHREGAPLKGDFSLSTLVKNLLSGVGSPDGKPAKIDAVIAGHTHTFNEYFIETNDKMKKVPLMQAGSQGLNFGRIDLVWDSKTQALNNDKTRVFAPVLISLKECSQKSNLFCHINSSAGTVLYEEVKVTEDEAIKAIIEDKKSQDNGKIKAMLQKELGSLDVEFNYDRIKESVLANFLTDSFLKIAKHEVDDVVTGSHKVIQADIAFLNASGIRRSLVATGPVVADGPFRIVTYEDFFKVLPISNEGVFLYPVNMEKLYRLIQTSIMTCGAYGALMPSGLRVTFEKDCNRKT
ncbi:MAG: bifunctional metallophosphatase/5'-nucleotidase, partial [Bdellovibrio sp.]|nr:bifunctional metallophosphatase/5'-nucleotidase [Bdellovibrio sp.]